MPETEHLPMPATTRVTWNKGKLIGARPPSRLVLEIGRRRAPGRLCTGR